MHRCTVRAVAVAALATCATFALAPPAMAHEHREVGALGMVVGWLDEPAVQGFKNAVQLILERHADESPVAGFKGTVVVIFGGKNGKERTEALDLEPAFGQPGEYHATLIPTRPGTYTFHIKGKVGSTRINQYFTSGDKTFSDIEPSGELEFPVKDPSRSELGDRAQRIDERVGDVRETTLAAAKDADDAGSKGTLGLVLGIVGVVLGLAALVTAMTRGKRTT